MGIATRGSALAIGFCFPIIGGILVSLRFYIRWQQRSSRKTDDWLCVPAWLCLTGCCASLLAGVMKNVFAEQPSADPDSVTEPQRILAQVTGALTIFWIGSNALIKLSILYFYRRIFIGRIFNICSWILVGLSLLWLVYSTLSWLLYCGTHLHANFEGGWAACDPWGTDLQIGVYCLDSFIDFFLLVLPIPFVWRLQLTLGRKLIIVMIFFVGGFAFVAGLNNTIVQLVYYAKPAIADTEDETNFFQGYGLLICTWPTIEIGVGLIACNLPSVSFRAANALPKLIRRVWTLSLSGISHAAGRLRSISGKYHTPSQPTNTTDDGGTASDWYHSRVPPLEGSEQRDSVAMISHIPLVHVGSRVNPSSETMSAKGRISRHDILESMENGSDTAIRGSDAV